MNWYGIWMLKVFGLAKQIQLAHVSDSQEPTESQDCPALAKCRWRLEWNEASCDKQEQTVFILGLASPGEVLVDAAKRYRVDTETLQKAVAEKLAAKRDKKTKATAKRKASQDGSLSPSHL
jgi:hypothetical protein